MAALLNFEIEVRSFEQIRDRIGEILVLELSQQSAISGNERLNARVYLERTVPFSHEELPAINIMLSRGDYDNMNLTCKDSVYSFDIDVYDCAKTRSDIRGDTEAMLRVHKLIGIIDAILSHPIYLTLQFQKPFVENTKVSGFKIADPSNNHDSYSVMMGRLNFMVRAPEANKIIEVTDLALNSTRVQLYESERGYYYDFVQ